MINLIQREELKLAELCRRHRVRVLEVFGSAADGTFRPGSSDIDFLVQFESLNPGEHYEAYFGLWEDLQELFERKIDLVEAKAMKNRYFIRGVNESRQAIYVADT